MYAKRLPPFEIWCEILALQTVSYSKLFINSIFKARILFLGQLWRNSTMHQLVSWSPFYFTYIVSLYNIINQMIASMNWFKSTENFWITSRVFNQHYKIHPQQLARTSPRAGQFNITWQSKCRTIEIGDKWRKLWDGIETKWAGLLSLDVDWALLWCVWKYKCR